MFIVFIYLVLPPTLLWARGSLILCLSSSFISSSLRHCYEHVVRSGCCSVSAGRWLRLGVRLSIFGSKQNGRGSSDRLKEASEKVFNVCLDFKAAKIRQRIHWIKSRLNVIFKGMHLNETFDQFDVSFTNIQQCVVCNSWIFKITALVIYNLNFIVQVSRNNQTFLQIVCLIE